MPNNQISVEQLWENSDVTLAKGTFANSGSSVCMRYVVRGATDEIQAARIAYATAPESLSDGSKNIPRQSSSVESRAGSDAWIVKVDYSPVSFSVSYNNEEEEGDLPEVCFQCNAGTMHVTRALSQECAWRRADSPAIPDADRVPIGWNGKFGAESDASGVDVPTAETREQYTRILKYDKVRSSSFRRKVARCVGKINSGEFHGWKKGEAMFLGMSYTTPQKGVEYVKVVFDFSIRLNEGNAKVCGISIGDLKGHDYVWAVTGGRQAENAVSPVIDYVFKAHVAGYANFSELGI